MTPLHGPGRYVPGAREVDPQGVAWMVLEVRGVFMWINQRGEICPLGSGPDSPPEDQRLLAIPVVDAWFGSLQPPPQTPTLWTIEPGPGSAEDPKDGE